MVLMFYKWLYDGERNLKVSGEVVYKNSVASCLLSMTMVRF